jgi:hypothetical protein
MSEDSLLNIENVYISRENELEELVPLINNNIVQFKKIVHKLEQRYKANKHDIQSVRHDTKHAIKVLIDEYNKNNLILTNKVDKIAEDYKIDEDCMIDKNCIIDINKDINKNKSEITLINLSINDKINKLASNIDYKFMFFTICNITITSTLILLFK